MTLTTYRISAARYASIMWTGTGSRTFGGRWNSPGSAVVYTAENRSLAAIEQLVHLIPPRVLTSYVISSITFDASHVHPIDLKKLPPNWADPVPPPQLKTLGDAWITAATHAVLKVPSAVMPGEFNYLLNPAHPAFPTFKTTPPEAFQYDERLK